MRKSVSVAFFSLMSTLLIFGTVIMGSSELVLFSNYFAQERYDVLDESGQCGPAHGVPSGAGSRSAGR